METPDITRAQILAIVQALIALVAAFGLNVSETQSTAIIQLATALAVVIPLADAAIRHGRARIAASDHHGAESARIMFNANHAADESAGE